MIRVIHLITSLGAGGAEGTLLRLAGELKNQQIEQTVVTLKSGGPREAELISMGVELHALGVNSFFSFIKGIFKFRKIARAYKPDVIQTWLYHADFMGLLARPKRAKLVWNIRCAQQTIKDAGLSTYFLIRLLSLLSPLVDGVIFNSTSGRKWHKEIGYRPKSSTVILNGFDSQHWTPNCQNRKLFRERYAKHESPLFVGLIARYHPIKDHDCFLRAISIARQSIPQITAVLAGEGVTAENNHLRSLAHDLGLEGHVLFLGRRKDTKSIVQGLDCCVLTSKSEGFPNVLGEAMLCGVPCVSTDVGDARDILDGLGPIAPSGVPDAVAAGIISTLRKTPKEMEFLAQSIRESIKSRYSMDALWGNYKNFLINIKATREPR
jgi:glycosyltransferase involved in cell wall biosynthesis